MKKLYQLVRAALWTATLAALFIEPAEAQVRAGASFLKVLPGARVQSMGGAAAAMLDDPHAVFANAGAAGLMREWQWAAGYTKWVADISQASFIYARRIPTPISRNTRFALGVLYQCVGEFDNSGGNLPPASASDVVLSLSVGQPFMVKKTTLSAGANIKYLNASLAHYTSSTMLYDAGLTAKSPQFKLGNKYRGAFGFGAGISQLGKGLVFEQIETPLPLSARWGLAAYLGTPKGLQMMFAADYVSVKDEESYVALGGEILINRLISLNAGYNFGNDLFKQFTVGAGIRLDDAGAAIGKAFPSRHNAFRLDVASLDGAEYFSRTYRGSAAHFTTVPEPFAHISPANGDTAANPVLRWQMSMDQDVFDRVRYRLLVDRDSSAIAHVMGAYDSNPELFASLLNDRMTVNIETERTFYPTAELNTGAYYWAVIALDEDGQARFAESSFGRMARFHVPSPPVEIKDIQFEHHPYITADDYQGVIRVVVANTGARSTKELTLLMEDSIEELEYSLETIAANDPSMVLPDQSVQQQTVASLAPGEMMTIELPWHTPLQGRHILRFALQAEAGTPLARHQAVFYTIPKGSMAPDDTLLTVSGRKKIVDLPLINEITFDAGSAVVKAEYSSASALQPVLAILAERLKDNPHLSVKLHGFIDSNSGESDLALADARAQAIRNALTERGAANGQITLIAGQRTPKRHLPINTQDLEWILEERRFVRITADNGDAAVLFAPIRQEEAEYTGGEVYFSAKIKSVLPMHNVVVNSAAGDYTSKQEMPVFERKKDVTTFVWRSKQNEIEKWVDRSVGYTLMVTDSLGRSFQSMPIALRVQANESVTEHLVSIPAQFAETDPSAELYWKRLTQLVQTMSEDPEMRVRFEGHACAIGREAVNTSLSKRRAERFSKEFQQQLRRQDGQTLGKMMQRIDQPVGWGESRPLTVDDSMNRAADNESAVGRKLNRRIEIIFYKNMPLS